MLNQYRLGNKKYLGLLMISAFLSALFGGVTIYLIGDVTDYAVLNQMEELLNISKFLLVVLLFELVFSVLSSYLKAKYLNKSMYDLRTNYAKYLFALDIQNLAAHSEDKYLSHLSNDMDRYEKSFYLNLIEVMDAAFSLLVSFIILASINMTLLYLALGLFVFFVLIARKTSQPIKKQEQIKSKSLSYYTNFISESLLGFYVIKQNNLEAKRLAKFEEIAKQVQADNYDLDRKSTHISALNSFVQMLVIFTLIFAGLYFARKLGLSLGVTILAGTAFGNSIWPMQTITPLISEMSGVSAVIDDFNTTLEHVEKDGNLLIDKIHEIEFSYATLGYRDQNILEHVNIKVRAGEKVLIIGSSGVGKSTILKSLRKQLAVKSGSLLINKANIESVQSQSYFKQLSVVDQIGFVFNASLKDNISLYKNANDEEIKTLLSDVGLDDLDLNYELRNNGSNLSGGQRARLHLARSLYLNSSLIICDEIFASLDKTVGIDIESKILQLNKTLINVSHVIYEENFAMYDSIYLVKDAGVFEIYDIEEIKALNLIISN